MRFALKGEQNKTSMNNRIDDLESNIEELRTTTEDLQKEICRIEKEEKERQERLEAQHQEKIAQLKKENNTLRKKLTQRLLNK